MLRITAFLLAVACGLGLFLYPQAVGWHQQRAISIATNAYYEKSATAVPREQSALLTAAQQYNAELFQSAGRYYNPLEAALDKEYQSQLQLGSGHAIAEISIPAISVRLPIYHGTSDEVLQNGAGHVYGTSLPVGGPNTHSVISAHSEVRAGEMFSHLSEVQLGDEFFITVAGQTLRYVVDQIEVVLPEEIEAAQLVPGEDYVTLLTCTPAGINSHRLLVRGARAGLVPMEPLVAAMPFPWWAVKFLGGMGVTGLFAALVNRRQRQSARRCATSKSAMQPVTAAVVVCLGLALTLVGMPIAQAATRLSAARLPSLDLPSPLPTPLPNGTETGTLTVSKCKLNTECAQTTATEFVLTPITAIGGSRVDLTVPAGWDLVSGLAVKDIAQTTLNRAAQRIVATDNTADGAAVFADLPVGLYYVTETTDITKVADTNYRATAFIVTIPFPDQESMSWQSDVIAKTKVRPEDVKIRVTTKPLFDNGQVVELLLTISVTNDLETDAYAVNARLDVPDEFVEYVATGKAITAPPYHNLDDLTKAITYGSVHFPIGELDTGDTVVYTVTGKVYCPFNGRLSFPARVGVAGDEISWINYDVATATEQEICVGATPGAAPNATPQAGTSASRLVQLGNLGSLTRTGISLAVVGIAVAAFVSGTVAAQRRKGGAR